MTREEIKARIDETDAQIAKLFKTRMELSRQLPAQPERDPAWERETLYNVTGIAGEELENSARHFFGTLLSLAAGHRASAARQESSPLIDEIAASIAQTPGVFPTRAVVACQGAEGAYSQQAACRLFPSPSILYFDRFEGVFRSVRSGMCRYGVLPIENSSAGSVSEVYDLMEKYGLSIVRSLKLQISHCLLAPDGAAQGDIREIVSHEQAISQCSEFLRSRPDVKVTAFANTALAARYAAQSGRRDIAAIASESCARLYGLNVLTDRIQNSDHNYTRFICISKNREIYPGAGKLTFMTSLPHEPGALAGMIARFAVLGLNISKIESRPIVGRDFEFRFCFDVEADIRDRKVQWLLTQLESAPMFMFLGAYQEIM